MRMRDVAALAYGELRPTSSHIPPRPLVDDGNEPDRLVHGEHVPVLLRVERDHRRAAGVLPLQSKELWLGLEDHVLAYADANAHRVSVFTGCVFEDDDPEYRGVLVPRRFWKIAAWRSSEGLAAAAFVLDQTTMLKPAMTPVRPAPLGRFRTFQVPVAEVQRITGIELALLEAADVLEPVAAARPGETWRALRAAADIRL
jgi:hypothetical protein